MSKIFFHENKIAWYLSSDNKIAWYLSSDKNHDINQTQMRNIWIRFFKNFFQGFLSMKFLKSPCEKLLAIKNSSKFILTSILNGSCIGRAKQAINVFLKRESSIFHPSHFFYFQILAVIDLKMQLSLKRKINCHIIQKLANEAKREWSLEFIIWI